MNDDCDFEELNNIAKELLGNKKFDESVKYFNKALNKLEILGSLYYNLSKSMYHNGNV